MYRKILNHLGCIGDPPSTPPGSTSDWDTTSKGVGTLITYTCNDAGPVTRVVCDAETLTWKPSILPQCNDDIQISC